MYGFGRPFDNAVSLSKADSVGLGSHIPAALGVLKIRLATKPGVGEVTLAVEQGVLEIGIAPEIGLAETRAVAELGVFEVSFVVHAGIGKERGGSKIGVLEIGIVAEVHALKTRVFPEVGVLEVGLVTKTIPVKNGDFVEVGVLEFSLSFEGTILKNHFFPEIGGVEHLVVADPKNAGFAVLVQCFIGNHIAFESTIAKRQRYLNLSLVLVGTHAGLCYLLPIRQFRKIQCPANYGVLDIDFSFIVDFAQNIRRVHRGLGVSK